MQLLFLAVVDDILRRSHESQDQLWQPQAVTCLSYCWKLAAAQCLTSPLPFALGKACYPFLSLICAQASDLSSSGLIS